MRFIYNDKQYEVMELCELEHFSSMGMVALFEVQHCRYIKDKRVICDDGDMEELRFVNYFYIDTYDVKLLEENCIHFIEHEYDSNYNELKGLLRAYRDAQIEYEEDVENNNDTKSSLDKLEYAQSDLYDYIAANVEGSKEGE